MTNFGNDLGNQTTLTADERRAEATRIVAILNECSMTDEFTPRETTFIGAMSDENEPVSPKQLFWLRDIKAKYAE